MRYAARCLLVLGMAVAAGAQPPPCQAGREVREALRKLTYTYKERLPGVQALREQFPGDVFLHRDYQQTAQHLPEIGPDAVVSEYRELLAKHPGDPAYLFLAASALVGYRSKEAIAQLERIPDYPPASLTLVQIFVSQNFRNKEKAQQHLAAYLKACPESLEAYAHLRQLDPSDFLRQSATKLRGLLRGKTEPEAVRSYGLLWGLEFKTTPLLRHAELRKQVAEDIKRLRAADPGTGQEYLAALREGYELIGDADSAKWAREEMTKRPPPNLRAMYALQDWDRKNPRPKPEAAPDAWAKYNEAALKYTAEMLRQYPNDRYVLERRFPLLRAAEKTTTREAEEVGEAIRRRSDVYLGGLPGANAVLQVAELYAAKGVALDRLPGIVQEALDELAKPMLGGFHSDLYPPVDPTHVAYTEQYRRFQGWASASFVWMKLQQKEPARAALQSMDTLLPKMGPSGASDSKDAAESRRRAQYPAVQGLYWQRMGEFALLEDRRVDALMFFQNGLVSSGALTSPAQARGELTDKTRTLWKELGGTNEGWQAWSTRVTAQPATGIQPGVLVWTRLDRRFPEFDLPDQFGQQWTLASLRGKTVLMNVWATW
jgi:hypothetical protein